MLLCKVISSFDCRFGLRWWDASAKRMVLSPALITFLQLPWWQSKMHAMISLPCVISFPAVPHSKCFCCTQQRLHGRQSAEAKEKNPEINQMLKEKCWFSFRTGWPTGARKKHISLLTPMQLVALIFLLPNSWSSPFPFGTKQLCSLLLRASILQVSQAELFPVGWTAWAQEDTPVRGTTSFGGS